MALVTTVQVLVMAYVQFALTDFEDTAASTSDSPPATGPGHDRGVWPGSGVLVHTTVDVALSDLPTNKRSEDLERVDSLRK